MIGFRALFIATIRTSVERSAMGTRLGPSLAVSPTQMTAGR